MNARCAISILALLSIPCFTASAQDHLEPERGGMNQIEEIWQYEKKLRAVLMKDAAPCYLARMVCLPSFEPEWMVTVAWEDEGEDRADAPRTYFVEYAGVEKQLWPRKKFRKVGVKRMRANLDRETAEAVHEVWRRMLHAVRYPEEDRFGTDGEFYQFSRMVPLFNQGRPNVPGGFEEGQIWSPDDGSLTLELIAIGEKLKEYANAPPEERDKLRAEVRALADQLKAKLDRPRPPG
jgi:hypothetical protein